MPEKNFKRDLVNYKLALIGKNISHSKSRNLYQELIGPLINYDYLDFNGPQDIPSIQELFLKYDGINITSPYKKHFLKQVKLTEVAQKSGAINCIGKFDDKLIGTNTDYFAILDIFKMLNSQNPFSKVFILGDGVMSNVTQEVLSELKLNYLVISRKLIGNSIENFNFINLLDGKDQEILIINTCSREFVFSGQLPAVAMFWDYNYDFLPHLDHLPAKCRYIDGVGLLRRQAEHAVLFWKSRQMQSRI